MALLVDESLTFGRQLVAGTMPGSIIELLDRVLLVLHALLVLGLLTIMVSVFVIALVLLRKRSTSADRA